MIKVENYLNTLRYVKNIFIKRGDHPIYLILFVTERCNARCRHCFVNAPTDRDTKEPELTLEEISLISQNMGNLLYLLPTGGEPFLREDLPDIINCFYTNNRLRNVGIPTNGSLTERTVASVQRILATCRDISLGVDISLDGLHAAHDRIREFPGLFEKAIATYWQLKELEKNNKNFKVCVEVTVSHYNQEQLPELYDYFINTLRVYNVFIRLVRGTPRDPGAKEVDVEKFEQLLMRVEHDLHRGAFHGHAVYPFSEIITARDIIGRQLTIKTLRENRFQIPCYAGILTGVIRSNGTVYPCELLDHEIGNLRQHHYNFKELWQSDKAKKIRRDIRTNKCYCTHECFITNNILFNPRMLPRVLQEYLRLKLRRKTTLLP
jgi:radical SAM protein with 4Fe4S-binding SPASM domain